MSCLKLTGGEATGTNSSATSGSSIEGESWRAGSKRNDNRTTPADATIPSFRNRACFSVGVRRIMLDTRLQGPAMPRRQTFGCDDFQQSALSRRKALQIGALGLTGLSLPGLFAAEARGGTQKATAKSVILLFQFGGPSHLDTFDPKPAAPREIRG